MKTSVFVGALTAVGLAAGAASAATLDDVRARGNLECGVNTGLAGFAFTDAEGEWRGFDADFCPEPVAIAIRKAGARGLVPQTFSPHALSTLTNGRRYLTVWQDTELLVELNESWNVTRILEPEVHGTWKTQMDAFGWMGLALSPDGAHAWIADNVDGLGGRLLRVNLRDKRLESEYDAPFGNRDLLLDPERERLYATQVWEGNLLVYDVSDGEPELLRRLELGRWLRVLHWEEGAEGRSLLAGSAGGVFRIDAGKL